MMKMLFASDEPSLAPAEETALNPASPCSTASAASPRNLADWATASTLIETSDCVDPMRNPDPTDTDQEPVSTDDGARADDSDDQNEDIQVQSTAQVAADATETAGTPEQSMAKQLAEELSVVKAENEQLRAQLDKVHTMLTGQVKLMNDAVRHNCSTKADQSSNWSTGTLGVRKSSCGLSQQLTNAASLAFTTPETKLGWLTRSAVMVAGVYALFRYGKAPALQIAHRSRETVASAGTTVRDHFAEVALAKVIR